MIQKNVFATLFYVVMGYSPCFSQVEACEFEKFQLEYFVSARNSEISDFLRSKGWDSYYGGQENKYQLYSTTFDSGFKSIIHVLESDDMNLILLKFDPHCWRIMKSEFETISGKNIFYDGSTEIATIYGENNEPEGFIEFYISKNNTSFDVIIYDKRFLQAYSPLKDFDRILSESEALRNNHNGMSYKSELDVELKENLEGGIAILNQLDMDAASVLQLNEIISSFNNDDFELFRYNSKMRFPVRGQRIYFEKNYTSSLRQMKKHYEKLIQILNGYEVYKSEYLADRKHLSNSKPELALGSFYRKYQEEAQRIAQNKYFELQEIKVPLVWTLSNDPDELLVTEYGRQKYPFILSEFYRLYTDDKDIFEVSGNNPMHLRFSVKDLYALSLEEVVSDTAWYRGNSDWRKVLKFSYLNRYNRREYLYALIGGALENNSITYEINLDNNGLNSLKNQLIEKINSELNLREDEDLSVKTIDELLGVLAKNKIDIQEQKESLRGQIEDVIEIDEIDEIDEIEDWIKEIDDVPFAVIENVPIYPGCENAGNNEAKKQCMNEKVMKFVQRKLNTDLANDLGLEGRQRISVQFKIDKNGNVSNVHARAPHPRLEQEAIDVIKALPKMIPGKQRGQAVGVLYALPILFQVEN